MHLPPISTQGSLLYITTAEFMLRERSAIWPAAWGTDAFDKKRQPLPTQQQAQAERCRTQPPAHDVRRDSSETSVQEPPRLPMLGKRSGNQRVERRLRG